MRHGSRGTSWLGVAFLMAAAPAGASGTTTSHYTGTAYAPGSGAILYSEEHWIVDEGASRERLVLYRCTDGRPFARKYLRYANTPWLPDVDYEDGRTGYRERVRVDGRQLSTTVVDGRSDNTDTATLAVHPDTVVDAGFDDFVRMHWDTISAPKGLSARFVVPSHGDDLGLNIRPDGADDPSARVRRFRMALDGWLGAIAPKVTLVYTADTRRLVGFEGLSNVRGDDGKTQKVRIVFTPEDDRPPASLAQVEAARRLPLAGRCTR
ncbi:hypothetical protein SAMN02800692_2872 [Luteibacter sp. UNC138MFCol5.1]|uniref:hypothetical protein n=1 Tax=Luteibacter sp. UNC138MFCol5.1 TaxID=1502774 RepID=UPI0008B86D2F|nr:hypothetical protein [Luteibacter sp. UNC138MFCol5.1]SEO93487.1 hypothetical protein SAMN02800692_2872 [Luteibacter sp. UNC138MFCol5.1]